MDAAPQEDSAPGHLRGGDALDQVCHAISEAASPEVGNIIVDLLALASRHPEKWSHDESQALLALARRLSVALNGTPLAGTPVLTDRHASPPLDSIATDENVSNIACNGEECAEPRRRTGLSCVEYSRRSVGEFIFTTFPWHRAAKINPLIDAVCIPCAAASGVIFFWPGSLRYELCYVCIGLCTINVPYCIWVIAQLNWQILCDMVRCFEPWFLLANVMVWATLSLGEEFQRQTEMHNFFHACIAYLHLVLFAVPLAFVDSMPDDRLGKVIFCLIWCFVIVSAFVTRSLSPPNWHGETITRISLNGSWYEFGTGPLISAALANITIFTGKFAYRGLVSQNAVVIRQPTRITLLQGAAYEASFGSRTVVPCG